MRTAFVSLGLLIVAGCASASRDIAPIYVSPMMYSNYTCEQLNREAVRLSEELQIASGQQDRRRTGDAVAATAGALLFWPSLFFIRGDDARAAEVARLKGEYRALRQASIQKNCGMNLPPVPGEEGAAPREEAAPDEEVAPDEEAAPEEDGLHGEEALSGEEEKAPAPGDSEAEPEPEREEQ